MKLNRLYKSKFFKFGLVISFIFIQINLPSSPFRLPPFGVAEAQSVPEISSIFPQGGQRGATVEITINGQNLAEANGLLISGDGVSGQITVRPASNAAVFFSGKGVLGQVSSSSSFSASIAIAPDAMVGNREIRVVSPKGVSNPSLFVVGDIPEAKESEPNNEMSQANRVNLPITISGRIDPEEDRDHFIFTAQKGERLIFEVNAFRLDSPLDSFLSLFDSQGKELTINEDANQFDSLIDYTILVSGDYLLQLRDLRNRGGSLFSYRLNLGTLPYLDSIFPLGGKRGANVNVSVSGRNLEGLASTQVAIAADAATGTQDMRVLTKNGFSNSRPFIVGDLAEFSEKEPNNSPAPATNSVVFPTTINGKMDVKGDKDTFSFKVEKGARLIFEVYGRRVGSALDPFLSLLDAQEKELANSDDAVGSDSMIDFTFQDAGEYMIRIRDLNDRGGADFGYRINVSPPMPDFNLTVSPDNPRVPRGGSVALTVNATKQGGFAEDILLYLPELPKGFSTTPAIIGANQTQATFTITASASTEVPLGLMPISVIGASSIKSQRATHQAQPLGAIKQGNQVLNRPTSGIFLTIMESPEFLIVSVPVSLSLTQGKSVSFSVNAMRKEGFTGAISLSVLGLPRGVNAAQVNIAENQNQDTVTLTAASDAAVGVQNIAVNGSATLNNQQISTFAPAIPLTVIEPPFILSVNPNNPALSQEGAVVITVSASRRGLFTGGISLSVSGLPEGVTAAEASISENQSEGTILLTADNNAKPGSFKNIVVSGNVSVNNQKVSQPAPEITLTITPIAPVAPTSKSETASPPASQ